jgi:hypothetical protein
MYVILKHIKNKTNKVLPVILVDNQSEILEFNSLDEAEKMRDIFQKNSDSGYKYEVKKI